MDGLFAKGSSLALAQLQAVLHALAYLQHLTANGLHLIHTVPLFTVANKSEFGLTSVAFQVVSKTEVTASNYRHRHESPVLLVLGMGGSRPASSVRVEWSTDLETWPSHAASYYTLCMSKDIFLKAYLLDRMSAINALTTVLPRFPRDEEDEESFYLTTYDKATGRRKSLCEWKLRDAQQNSDVLEYYHDSNSERDYLTESRGNVDVKHSLRCESLFKSEKHCLTMRNLQGSTRNQLLIPTTFRPDYLEILVRGETVIQFSKTYAKKQWRWALFPCPKFLLACH